MGIINRNHPTPNQCAAKVTDELFVITELLVFLYLLKMFPLGANSCPSIPNCKRKQCNDATRADWQHGLVTGLKSRLKTRAKNSEESFAERKTSPLWVGNAFYFQAFRVITRQLHTANQLKKTWTVLLIMLNYIYRVEPVGKKLQLWFHYRPFISFKWSKRFLLIASACSGLQKLNGPQIPTV